MRKFKTKFVITIIAFIVGISAVYLNRNIFLFVVSEISTFFKSSVDLPQISATSPAKKNSGRVEIRFVELVQGERETEAKYELTNNSDESVYYYSYSKDSYPFPVLKRNGKIVPDNRGRCGTGIEEQNLLPGETVFYRVWKSEVTYEPTKNSWRESDKPTQLGFPIAVGNERRKETLWTEEIKFP